MSEDRLSFEAEHKLGAFELNAAFEMPVSGVTALFGPSGSGKTTILRILAGLERPKKGRVTFGEHVWLDTARRKFIPTHKREVGLVFQDTRLFAHRNVRGNLAFAQSRSGATDGYLADVVEAFDLADLTERATTDLSGGEKQRVALARTLLSRPRLLLLDEPMAGLDTRRKAEIMPYLAGLSRRFSIPIVLVSHSIEEVVQLAETMVILDRGQVAAQGAADDLLERADLQALTGRFEAGSRITASVLAHDRYTRLTKLSLGTQTLTMPMLEGLVPSDKVRLRIRARDVAIATERPKGISIRNIIGGVITGITEEEDTAFAEITLDTGDGRIRARITRASVGDLDLVTGKNVYALIKSVSFDRRGLASMLSKIQGG